MIKVLIIDDDDDLQFMYQRIFSKRAPNLEIVGKAYDGDEGVKLFTELDPKPDIIIMDQRMPRMDGITATELIKELDEVSRIIFVSGDESVKDEALAAGADLFFVKPVHFDVLFEAINQTVQ